MLLIQDKTNRWFSNSDHDCYIGAYYKNEKDKALDRKTYFKNIHMIEIYPNGIIDIGGKAGHQCYMGYSVEEAIRKYNFLCRNYEKYIA